MTATAALTERSTWQLDPVHSSVEFAVKHLMIATVKGSFSGFEASLTTDDANPNQAKVTAKADASTISTKNDQRDTHLRSADFFETEKYPTIEFESTKITGDTTGDFQITGNLTMHGVTKAITLDATFEGQGKDPWGGTRIGYSAKGKIRRSDFGLTWNQALETGGVVVSDDIKISVEAQFVRK